MAGDYRIKTASENIYDKKSVIRAIFQKFFYFDGNFSVVHKQGYANLNTMPIKLYLLHTKKRAGYMSLTTSVIRRPIIQRETIVI